MINKGGYHNVIEQVLLTLEDQILQQIKEGKIVKKSGDNVRTGIHRFQEFVDSANLTTENVSTSFSKNLPDPKVIVEEIEEETTILKYCVRSFYFFLVCIYPIFTTHGITLERLILKETIILP